MKEPSEKPAGRRIIWSNVLTVISAAILIGAEIFGAAYAGGWAFGSQLGLGEYGTIALQGIFFIGGIVVMAAFIRAAQRAEPFTTRA